MLVLTRKQRQTITIGDAITVTILKVQGRTVRLGIDAPDGVRVLRGELVEREAAPAGSEPKASRGGRCAAGGPATGRDLGTTSPTRRESPLRGESDRGPWPAADHLSSAPPARTTVAR